MPNIDELRGSRSIRVNGYGSVATCDIHLEGIRISDIASLCKTLPDLVIDQWMSDTETLYHMSISDYGKDYIRKAVKSGVMPSGVIQLYRYKSGISKNEPILEKFNERLTDAESEFLRKWVFQEDFPVLFEEQDAQRNG